MPTRTGYTFSRWVETGKNKAKKNNLTITADSSSGTTLGYVSMPTISFAKQLTIAVSFDYKITARDSNISSISLKASATLSNISIDNSEYPSLGNDWTRYAKVLTVKTSSWALWTNMSGLYIACPNVAGTLTMEVRNVQIETNDSVTDYEPYEYTSTTQYTKVGDQTLKAIWTANDYTLTLYENKNILKGGKLNSSSDWDYWNGKNYDKSNLSIVVEDGETCTKTNGRADRDLIAQTVNGIKPNTSYIISVRIKVANYTSGYPSIHIPATRIWSDGTSEWGDVMEGGAYGIESLNGQGWTDLYYTKTTSGFTSADPAYFMIYASGNVGGQYYVHDFSFAEATGSSKRVTYNSTATLSVLSQDGYAFQGYYTKPVGGVKIFDAEGNAVANVSGYTDANGKWIRAENVSLYAQWA